MVKEQRKPVWDTGQDGMGHRVTWRGDGAWRPGLEPRFILRVVGARELSAAPLKAQPIQLQASACTRPPGQHLPLWEGIQGPVVGFSLSVVANGVFLVGAGSLSVYRHHAAQAPPHEPSPCEMN